MANTIVCNGNRLFGSYAASIPTIKGVPVPNSEEALDWWFARAEENIDAVLSILAECEKHGLKWTKMLINKIIENCLV